MGYYVETFGAFGAADTTLAAGSVVEVVTGSALQVSAPIPFATWTSGVNFAPARVKLTAAMPISTKIAAASHGYVMAPGGVGVLAGSCSVGSSTGQTVTFAAGSWVKLTGGQQVRIISAASGSTFPTSVLPDSTPPSTPRPSGGGGGAAPLPEGGGAPLAAGGVSDWLKDNWMVVVGGVVAAGGLLFYLSRKGGN